MKSVKELYEEVRQKQTMEQNKYTDIILKYIEKAVCKALEKDLNSIELCASLYKDMPCRHIDRSAYFYTRFLDVDREMELDVARTLESNSDTYGKSLFRNIESILNTGELGYREAKLSIEEHEIGTDIALSLSWDRQ